VGQFRSGRAGKLPYFAAWLLLHLSGKSLPAAVLEPPHRESLNATAPPATARFSAPASKPLPSWIGNIRTRSQLSGDWAGLRTGLAESGITFFGDVTQYYQGMASGGLVQQFRYGGRGDYLVDVDSEKLGLWNGGHFDFRGETRLGQDCNGIDGSFTPSNFAMALPFPDQNVTTLTGVQYTQDFADNLSVFFGKLNLLDGTPTSYARGMRLNYFWNTAMQNNISRSYLIPSTLGTGFTVRKDAKPVFSFYLLDTHYTPTTSGFSTLFSNGVLLYGEYRLTTNWFDRPGHSAFGFLYSTATRTSLDGNPYVLLGSVLSGAPLPTKSSAWTATYRIDQVLYADAENANQHWSLNSDLGLTEGDPNPIRWFANLSLVGTGRIRSRPNDTVGIGYYHLGASDLPVLRLHGFIAESGVELFYNAALTPSFHVTPDFQILDPANSHNPTTVLVGLRARLSF
jgi:porin